MDTFSEALLSKKTDLIPTAYDWFAQLIGYCPEEWSNRLMVTELWVCEALRRKGVGKRLMDKAKEVAVRQRRRAVILETQSCNMGAIAFYLSQGFELIGFDTCCYTNDDVGRREVRIDLGYFFHREGRRR